MVLRPILTARSVISATSSSGVSVVPPIQSSCSNDSKLGLRSGSALMKEFTRRLKGSLKKPGSLPFSCSCQNCG